MGFTYFYTAFTFKPDETAEQLRKNGGFIPGIRPGRPTQDYLARVVTRITFAGALFLAIVAVSPSVIALAVPGPRHARPGRHEPADRGVGRGRDDEADRSPADDAELRRLHPVTSGRWRPGSPRPDDVVVLLGAPGAGKGTQAPAPAARLGVPVLASGDLLRAAVAADGPPLGREADRYMSRGQLVPDETIVRVFLDRLEAADAVDGAILDGFPRTRVQAEALDDALEDAGRRVDRAGYIDVPLEDLVSRMANRRICTANGHVYNLVSNPPRVDGRLRPRRLGARPARRRRRDDGPGADGPAGPAAARGRRPLPRRAASSRTVDGRLGIDAVTEALMTAARRRRTRPDMVTRKSRAEIERMRRAGRVVAEVLDLIEAELEPGVSTADLDAIAEAHIRASGGDPVVQGLPGHQPAPAVPGQRVHLDRRRDRPRHPGRADDPRRPDRVGRRRRDRRRLARRRRADVLRRRAAARGGRADRPDPRRR